MLSTQVLKLIQRDNIYIFIVIALNEASILVAVQFSMQNIYELRDLGRTFWRSNVDVLQ